MGVKLAAASESVIQHMVDNLAFEDAGFLAERLHAEVGTEDSLHLLADCYFRCGEHYKVYSLFKCNTCSSPRSKFLMAKCCYLLKKYTEAESYLTSNSVFRKDSVKCEDIINEFGPSAPFALVMLADIYRRSCRNEKAKECYKRSLKLNPCIWSAFQALADMGDRIDGESVFVKPSNLEFCVPPHVLSATQTKEEYTPRDVATPWNVAHKVEVQPSESMNCTQPLLNLSTNTTAGSIDVAPSPDCRLPTSRESSGDRAISPCSSTGMDSSGGDMSSGRPLTRRQAKMMAQATGGVRKSHDDSLSASLSMEQLPPDTPSPNFNDFVSPAINPVGGTVGVRSITPAAPSKKTSVHLRPSNLARNSIVAAPRMATPSPANREGIDRIFALPENVTPGSQSNRAPPPVFTLSNMNAAAAASSRTPNSNDIAASSLTTASSQPNNSADQQNSGGAPRRSTRLYGSNQLKENSKAAFAKASGTRRQKRAPNKSNSISDVASTGEDSRVKLSCILSATADQSSRSHTQSSAGNSRKAAPSDLFHYECSVSTILPPHATDLERLLSVLRLLGKACCCLSRYDSAGTLSALLCLPSHHYNTGFVLNLVGQAHFEAHNLQYAADALEEMWELEPARVEGLDLYSTVLWQLRRTDQLSHLAHQLTSTATRHRPQVWAVVGNCFSLNKDHESAVSFLNRAIQLDSSYTYAYTLLGFEHLEMDMMERAESCFRNALRCNPAHYKAWFGLGNMYYRQEKYANAELHYGKALSIKRNSPVLLCHLAVVYHAQQKSVAAVELLNEALALDPTNCLCKFQKANILNAMNRQEEALSLLEELKQQVPHESLLYFLTGKVHKKLGNTHLELMNFAWAMDSDPKGNNSLIKQAIERKFLPQDEDVRSNVDRILEESAAVDESLSDTEEMEESSDTGGGGGGTGVADPAAASDDQW